MSETEAERIAERVRAGGLGPATVRRDGHFFVVVVETADSTHTLSDEEDWRWLRRTGRRS